MVLLVASLGWVFDVFEGQIFVASMREAMPALLPQDLAASELSAQVNRWNNIALGFFLFGGAVGGVVFGAMSDRIGRSRTLIFTILVYSLFTSVTAFAETPWQMVILRFIVAMGVGGEWAVASAMVAEVMPSRSRPIMSSIFHASSVLGTLLAAAAGAYIVGNPDLGENAWRWGFALGAFPALLTVYVRWKLKEPKQWRQMRERVDSASEEQPGRVFDLFKKAHLKNTLIGVSLASIGLVTFWGVHIYGKNALLSYERNVIINESQIGGLVLEADQLNAILEQPDNLKRMKRAEMTSMVLHTLGGGLGLVLFGGISQRIGRKRTFAFYHAGAFVISLFLFRFLIDSDASRMAFIITLPFFGFLTLGLHAGYAVYFPELYPTRLRGTGSGFCFNMGRVATGLVILLAAWMQGSVEQGGLGMSVKETALLLNWLFLAGIVLVFFAKETRGEELVE